jgi:hypothetical protein
VEAEAVLLNRSQPNNGMHPTANSGYLVVYAVFLSNLPESSVMVNGAYGLRDGLFWGLIPPDPPPHLYRHLGVKLEVEVAAQANRHQSGPRVWVDKLIEEGKVPIADVEGRSTNYVQV